HAAENDRLLHAAVPFDRQLLDEDLLKGRTAGPRGLRVNGGDEERERRQGDGERPTHPPPGSHRTVRLARSADECSASSSGAPAAWGRASRNTKFPPSTSTSMRALSTSWPRTMASASGSSMCF